MLTNSEQQQADSNKDAIKREQIELIIKPISFEIFKKSIEEKTLLKDLKKKLFKGIRKQGLDHRKQMNLA